MIEERSGGWFRPVSEESFAGACKEGDAATVLMRLEDRFGPLEEQVREQVAAAYAQTLPLLVERVLPARLEDVLRD